MTAYPRVGIYASLRNSDTILGDGHGNPNAPNIAKLARWDDCVLDLGPAIEQPAIIAALRAANPAIRLHAYVPLKAYDWPGAFYQEMYLTVAALNGFLYRVDGSMWEPNVNLARPDVVEAVAQVIARHLPGWDACFLDVCPPGMPNAAASGIEWTDAGHFATEKEFQEAWAQGHAALMQAIRCYTQRPDLVIENNPPFSHGDINGQVREAFPTLHVREPSNVRCVTCGGSGIVGKDLCPTCGGNGSTVIDYGSPWYQNMVVNGFGQPGLLREVFREPRASWLCSAPFRVAGVYSHNHPENDRRHRYGLASACLGGAFHSFGRYEGDDQWRADRLNFFYPEYQHPQKGKYWLGKATGAAIQDGVTLSWTREFQHGIVISNPTDKPVSRYFDRLYRPIGGVAKTAFSVPAHDGLLLEAV